MSAIDYLREKALRIDNALKNYFVQWINMPQLLKDAVSYSLFSDGKRLRPAFCLASSETVAGNDEPALPVACAIEMIHTYSLIHDDLPSMDDDDLRRGKPSCHKVYGEAMAILAGDALLTMAFELAAESDNPEIIREIASAAGPMGMLGGQVLDLQSESREISIDELRRIHANKTGALIRVSLRTGAILAGADKLHLEALTRYGENVGLAFQIADDILDCVGNEEVLGKPIGSDEASHKATYPALLGLDKSREFGQKAVADAIDALNCFGPEGDKLRSLARFIMDRDK